MLTQFITELPYATLVNGWAYRQVFERQAGEQVFWITQPVPLHQAEPVKRNSNQESAGLAVWVSAAGLRSHSVGLFAEVLFTTNNQYVSYSDALILGKVNPDMGITESPYHALSDESSNRDKYKGCRPADGTLFHANRMANFIIGQIDK